MRQEQRPIAAALSAVEFKFRFQTRDAGAQRACSVTIQAVTVHDAAAIFRTNLADHRRISSSKPRRERPRRH
jgi:hypothetical protein